MSVEGLDGLWANHDGQQQTVGTRLSLTDNFYVGGHDVTFFA